MKSNDELIAKGTADNENIEAGDRLIATGIKEKLAELEMSFKGGKSHG
jgi:Trk K+ transport system NAD-binding subunit